MYCYLGVETSIQTLYNQPDFHSNCEKWCQFQGDDEVYTDVYSGRVWKDFRNYDKRPFLSQKHNLALMMNADFFPAVQACELLSRSHIYDYHESSTST